LVNSAEWNILNTHFRDELMLAEKQLQQRDVLPSSVARHLRRRIQLFKQNEWRNNSANKKGRKFRKNRTGSKPTAQKKVS
jgi:hypothetical protein